MHKKRLYSLSFVPSGDVYERCSAIISKLSAEHDAPKFDPHITIIPHIALPKEEVIKKTMKSAKGYNPFEIKLAKIEHSNKYFVCVFFIVNKSKKIMEINSNARKIFGRKNDPNYIPHLSLLYGNFSSKTKKEIVKKLRKLINISFTAKSISIFHTTGKPEEWKIVKEIELTGPHNQNMHSANL